MNLIKWSTSYKQFPQHEKILNSTSIINNIASLKTNSIHLSWHILRLRYKLAAAMGRCQSTPGLVESRGRIPLEEMWVSPVDTKSTHAYSTGHSLFSPSPSPVTSRGLASTNVNVNNVARSMDSPMSATSSGHSSEDQTTRAPQSATQPSTGRQSTHSGKYFILNATEWKYTVLLLNSSTSILFLLRSWDWTNFFLCNLMDVKSRKNLVPRELNCSMHDLIGSCKRRRSTGFVKTWYEILYKNKLRIYLIYKISFFEDKWY